MNKKQEEEKLFERVVEYDDNIGWIYPSYMVVSLFAMFFIFNSWLFELIILNNFTYFGIGFSLATFLFCLMECLKHRKVYYKEVERK